ncbi:MAG: tetratricopeptide repeat protein, partial [Ktedonobacteraceae bacterium]|nr:tetratricopeptide repeat protein [Ktedonobacteraceae bacterium]
SMHRLVKAYVGLGKTCLALQQYEEAIAAFDRALEMNTRLALCHYLKGICYFRSRYYKKAYDLYEQAIAAGFTNAAVYMAKGDAMLALGNYVKAREHYDFVISSFQGHTWQAYAGRGKAFFRLNMVEEAIQSYEVAAKLNPLLFLQAWFKWTLEDIDSYIEVRLHVSSPVATHYKQKGDILLLRQYPQGAVEAYTKAMAGGERSADIYYRRGIAYVSLANLHKAEQDYRQALDLDCGHPDALRELKKIEFMKAAPTIGFLKKVAKAFGKTL